MTTRADQVHIETLEAEVKELRKKVRDYEAVFGDMQEERGLPQLWSVEVDDEEGWENEYVVRFSDISEVRGFVREDVVDIFPDRGEFSVHLRIWKLADVPSGPLTQPLFWEGEIRINTEEG